MMAVVIKSVCNTVGSGCVMVCVTFRDGIEDEWYLVSLMCRLTETFADLVVR